MFQVELEFSNSESGKYCIISGPMGKVKIPVSPDLIFELFDIEVPAHMVVNSEHLSMVVSMDYEDISINLAMPKGHTNG